MHSARPLARSYFIIHKRASHALPYCFSQSSRPLLPTLHSSPQNAVHCIGHRSALHRLMQCTASAITPHCISDRSTPHRLGLHVSLARAIFHNNTRTRHKSSAQAEISLREARIWKKNSTFACSEKRLPPNTKSESYVKSKELITKQKELSPLGRTHQGRGSRALPI